MKGTFCCLNKPVTGEKVRQAIFSIHNTKSPGPDGYNSQFCKDTWEAYDSIEWSFLKDMLRALKFPAHFTNLLMECVTTPHYSLSLNGEIFGFFQGKRGLRHASGLQMNKHKSNVYGNGIAGEILEKFADLTGLKVRKLPFKYLGIPISAKKLSVLDCNMLVKG
ncbi:uncharacterized protein LOC141588141 [Silene latifolia]|uniref:uncharacterized protein LOC141588141 n=1 Tax=Silene latifolia TaxID=37657 RepID=UPI003D785554